MRPSLIFLSSLTGLAVLSAAASLGVLEWQDHDRSQITAAALAGGNVDAGKRAIGRFGCGGCHVIPGVDGADGRVGPSLDGVALRAQIAGRTNNSPDGLIRWIQHPQAMDPGNAMPELGVSDTEARDIATYLYTLRSEH